jgi:sodium-dependent phosphate cotransporter
MTDAPPNSPSAQDRLAVVARLLYLLLLLYGFLIAISMMSGGIKLLGGETSGALFTGVQNPFAALAVGVLATVLVQSSSATTSTIVALVGSGQLDVVTAVPMIMGANIGTTVTNTIVAIGSVRRSAEFKRSFAAATMHDFFNVICVLVFLPLQLATGFLSDWALTITNWIGVGGGASYNSPIKSAVKGGYKFFSGLLESVGFSDKALAIAIIVLGMLIVLGSLVQITRTMRLVIAQRVERAMNNALSRSGVVGIGFGAVATMAVQSSSITTSLLVPMCGSGILKLSNAFPIMLGANIGTTVTALLASLAADSSAGLTIAIVHVLFNVLGIALFYPIPWLRAVPIFRAQRVALAAADNRLWILAYTGGIFILLPLLGYLLLA